MAEVEIVEGRSGITSMLDDERSNGLGPMAFRSLALLQCPAVILQCADDVIPGEAELAIPGSKMGLILPAYRLAVTDQVAGAGTMNQARCGLGIGVVFEKQPCLSRLEQLGR